MASRHVFPVGTAAGDGPQIGYPDEGGSPVDFYLGAKLIDLEPIDSQMRRDWWAADYIHRWVVEIGDARVYELLGTIRYDDTPGDLKTMLRRGLQGATLTYKLTAAGTEYPVQLVRVVGASSVDQTPIQPDRDRWRVGNYMTRIHIRRVDGGSLDGLLTGANTL